MVNQADVDAFKLKTKVQIGDKNTKHSIRRADVKDRLDELAELMLGITNPNVLLEIAGVGVLGNTVTFVAPIKWRINNVVYSKNTNSVFNVPFTSEGFSRIDVVIADTASNISLIQGQATQGIAVAPPLPANTVLVSALNIYEDYIDNPIPDLSSFVTNTYLAQNYYTKAELDGRFIENSPLTRQSGSIKITGKISTQDRIQLGGIDGNVLDFYADTDLIGPAAHIENTVGGDIKFRAYFADLTNTVATKIKVRTLDSDPTRVLTIDEVTGEIKYTNGFAPVSPSGDYIQASPSVPQNKYIWLDNEIRIVNPQSGGNSILNGRKWTVANTVPADGESSIDIDGSIDFRAPYSHVFRTHNQVVLALQAVNGGPSGMQLPLLAGVGDRTLGVDVDGYLKIVPGGGDVYTSGGPVGRQTITKDTEFSNSLYLTSNPFAVDNFNLVGANTADGKVYRIDTALFAKEGDYIKANPDIRQDAFIDISGDIHGDGLSGNSLVVDGNTTLGGIAIIDQIINLPEEQTSPSNQLAFITIDGTNVYKYTNFADMPFAPASPSGDYVWARTIDAHEMQEVSAWVTLLATNTFLMQNGSDNASRAYALAYDNDNMSTRYYLRDGINRGYALDFHPSTTELIYGYQADFNASDQITDLGVKFKVIGSFEANTLAIKSTPSLDTLPTQVLTRDSVTGEVKYVPSTSFGGGGSSYTFNNGLTENLGVVGLGGVLNADTEINSSGNSFFIGNTDTYLGSILALNNVGTSLAFNGSVAGSGVFLTETKAQLSYGSDNSVEVLLDRITLRTDNNLNGAYYFADYSAGKTFPTDNLWIPNSGWVNSQIATAGGNYIQASPSSPQSNFISLRSVSENTGGITLVADSNGDGLHITPSYIFGTTSGGNSSLYLTNQARIESDINFKVLIGGFDAFTVSSQIELNRDVIATALAGVGDRTLGVDSTGKLIIISGGGGGSGTVTSVSATVPTGFAISGSPITTSGTLALTFASGYALPTTAKQTQWDDAYTSSHLALSLGTANGLSLAAGQVLSLAAATGSTTGALTSADWTTFNNKVGLVGGKIDSSLLPDDILDTNEFYQPGGVGTAIKVNRTFLQTDWLDPRYARYITLTTTGTTGVATWNASTGVLNIPNYASGGGGGEPVITPGTVDQYWRGDKTWQSALFYPDPALFTGGGTSTSDYFSLLTVPVSKGGTGATTLTGILQGNGTSAVTALSGTGFVKLTAGTVSYDTASYVPDTRTVAGFALTGNVTLANLTATNGTLTFSGTYTGATARTIGLNLGNANSWTAKQTFATPTTAIASLVLPHGVAPTTPVNGDVWTTTAGAFHRINGVTMTVAYTQNIKGARLTKTAAYTILLSDFGTNGHLLLEVDASAGAVTITLPTAVTSLGYTPKVVKSDASANAVTVKGNGAELINAANTDVLSTQYASGIYDTNTTKWFKF